MNRGELSHGSLLPGLQRAIRASVTLACMTLIAQPALARGKPVIVRSTAQAVVLAPLSLVKVDTLDFGMIVPQGLAGTVIANPATRVCTVTGPIVHAGRCQPALIAGMVSARTQFKIELQGNTNLTGPGAAMLLDTFTLVPVTGMAFVGAANPAGAARGQVTLRVTSTTRLFTFAIGGTLHVNANQAPGVYRGTFSMQANYQ